MTTYEPTSGSIIHIELATDDPAGTRGFFETVFGWTFESIPEMAYMTFSPPNPPGGGVATGEAEGPFTPPPTLLYVNVDDLAETDEAIRAAGGEVLVDDMAVPEMGRFTVFREPGGVVEAAWETTSADEPSEGGFPPFTDEPEAGSVTHFELYSDDPEATRAFHEAVFGWGFEPVEGSDYVTVRPPTPPYGGMMAATDEMPVGTLLYLLVEDAAAAVETIEAAGGAVLREPFPVEGWGTMAVFEAPGGTPLAVWGGATTSDEPPEPEPAD